MRNQRSNFIPVPTKPAKSQPKPLPRLLAQKKSCSCQTERVVLIKEENLTFYPCTRLGQNDGGMRRDYVKAVNYINSCHKFINTIVEKNNADAKSGVFLLPMVTNFIPIFPHLLGKKRKEKTVESKKSESKVKPKSAERKIKSNFAVKKVSEETESSVDPAPVGDCGKKVPQILEDKYAAQVTDIVKEQLQQFLNTLHEDMSKEVKKVKSEPPKQCKNLEIVRQRLEELSQICFLQKHVEAPPLEPTVPPPPPTPPQMNTPEGCSVILSDTDCEEKKKPGPELRITCYDASISSLESESSDIKSDSDLEINI